MILIWTKQVGEAKDWNLNLPFMWFELIVFLTKIRLYYISFAVLRLSGLGSANPRVLAAMNSLRFQFLPLALVLIHSSFSYALFSTSDFNPPRAISVSTPLFFFLIKKLGLWIIPLFNEFIFSQGFSWFYKIFAK